MLGRLLQALVVVGILLGALAYDQQQARVEADLERLEDLIRQEQNMTWNHQTASGSIIVVEYPIPPRGDMTIEAWINKIEEESGALLALFPANVT